MDVYYAPCVDPSRYNNPSALNTSIRTLELKFYISFQNIAWPLGGYTVFVYHLDLELTTSSVLGI